MSRIEFKHPTFGMPLPRRVSEWSRYKIIINSESNERTIESSLWISILAMHFRGWLSLAKGLNFNVGQWRSWSEHSHAEVGCLNPGCDSPKTLKQFLFQTLSSLVDYVMFDELHSNGAVTITSARQQIWVSMVLRINLKLGFTRVTLGVARWRTLSAH